MTADQNIQKGDLVEYVDTEGIREGKTLKTIMVAKRGIWDGEKVELNDKERTTVRKKAWLTLIEKGMNWYCEFDNTNINSLLLFNSDGKKLTMIAVPPGKSRVDLISFTKFPHTKLGQLDGYFHNYEGLLVISTDTERQVVHKGKLLTTAKF